MAIKRIEITLDVGEIHTAIHEYIARRYETQLTAMSTYKASNVSLIVGPSMKNGVGFQPKCEGALVTIEESIDPGTL